MKKQRNMRHSIVVKMTATFLGVAIISNLVLFAVGLYSIDNTKNIANDGIQDLYNATNNSIGQMNDYSVQTMEKKIMRTITDDVMSRVNATTERIEEFMKRNTEDIVFLSTLKPSNETYLNFSASKIADIHDPAEDSTELITGSYEPAPENTVKSAIFRDVYFIDKTEKIDIHIGSSSIYYGLPVISHTLVCKDISALSDGVFNRTLADVFTRINADPSLYKGKLFAANTTLIAADGKERNSNLICEPLPHTDKQHRFYNGVWRFGTPVYVDGEYKGVLVADINHLAVMKIVNDYVYGMNGYAYMLEITGDRGNVELSSPYSMAWDSFVAIGPDGKRITNATPENPLPEGSTILGNETYAALPDGSTVHYGDVWNDSYLGITLAHPKQRFVGWMDPAVTLGGIPALSYLANQQYEHRSGIGRYWFAGVEKFTAYAPVNLTVDNVMNMHDWSIGCTSPVDEFMGPAREMRQNLTAMNSELINEIKNEKDLSAEKMNESSASMVFGSLTIFLIVIIVASTTAILGARSITSPIRHMAEVAERVANGDFDAEISIKDRKDEVGELAWAFGQMIKSVKAAIRIMEKEEK